MPTILRDPTGRFAFLIPIIIGAAIGAGIGAMDAIINGGPFLDKVLRGAVGGAMFGVAFAFSPYTAMASAAVSVAKGGSRDGNFFKNLNDSIIQDGAFAIVASAAVGELNAIQTNPVAAPFLGGFSETVLTAFTYLGAVNTAVSWYNVACDPEFGGLFNNDICYVSKRVNGSDK